MISRTITLEPVAGKTLLKQTYKELIQGFTFKVVSSSTPKWRRGDRCTYSDLLKDREYHGTEYEIFFNVLTMAEYDAQQSEVDYEYSRASEERRG